MNIKKTEPNQSPLYKLLSDKYHCSASLAIEIINLSQTTHITKGTILLNAGYQETVIRFVNIGLLCAYSDTNETIQSHWYSREGYFASSMESLLEKKPSQYSIKALEDSNIQYITAESMNLLISNHTEANSLMGKLIADYMSVLTIKASILSQTTAIKKYELFLKTFPGLGNRLKQHEVASYLQVHATTLSSIRGQKS